MKLETRLKRAAYHEAGHVVAQHVGHLGVHGVHIGEDGSGHAHGSGKFRRLFVHQMWDDTIAGFAGPYAEARCSRSSIVATLLTFGAEDYQKAQVSIAWLVENNFVASSREANDIVDRHTRKLLTRYWPYVVSVAEKLIQARKLDAQQLLALLPTYHEVSAMSEGALIYNAQEALAAKRASPPNT